VTPLSVIPYNHRVSIRNRLYVQLSPEAWPKPGLSPVNYAVAGAIILAVTAAILETEKALRGDYALVFESFDVLLGMLFVTEYLLRLWVIGDNPKYSGVVGRIKYIISPMAVIDLIAVLPFVLAAGLGDTVLLRLFRLLRLLTLAKLGRYSEAFQNIGMALKDRRYELFMSLAAAFVVMLFAASALFYTEGDRNPESFGSIPRALWWGVATVTAVGYSEAFPMTILGKIFAAIFAIAAVGIVALPTGILAASFSNALQRERGKGKLSDK